MSIPNTLLTLCRTYDDYMAVVSTADFVSMLYDKLVILPSQPLQIEQITKEIIKKPLFSELFGLNPTSPRKGENSGKISQRSSIGATIKM